MIKPRNNRVFVNIFLHIIGFVLCIAPPVAATLLYFPLWREAGDGAAVCGFTALLIVISALPLYKALRRLLASPASYTVWLILFLLFFALSRIAEQMTVISFVGFAGNILGAACFKLAKKGRVKNEGE